MANFGADEMQPVALQKNFSTVNGNQGLLSVHAKLKVHAIHTTKILLILSFRRSI